MTIDISPTTIGILLGVATALVRLIPATKPWWSFLPEKTRFLPPLIVVLAGLVVGLISDPTSWLGQLELVLPTLLAIVAPGALQSGASHSFEDAQAKGVSAELKRLEKAS